MMNDSPPAGVALKTHLDSALPQGVEWSERDLAMIQIAQSQANDIAALEALLADQGPTVEGSQGQARLNPVFAELRQQRLALSRILSEVRMPEDGIAGQEKNVKAQRAANMRWDRKRAS